MNAATTSASTGTTGLERRPASEREGRGSAERSPSHRPLRSKVTAGALVALAVGGLALGRFVFLDGGEDGAAPPSAAASPADQIATLEAAVEADPDDLRSHQLLGAAYLRRAAETGDPSYYGLASRALERAEEIAPEDPETGVVSGGLALARHRFADALALGSAASRANPDDPDALIVMVDAQIELGRYDEARETLDRLLGTRPGLAAFTRLSYFEQLHGNTARAVLTMQEAESAGASPFDRAVAATFLGDLRFGAGDLDKAEAAYRRALDGSPGLVLAELGRARVLEARGERAEAVEALSALTERYPQPAALA
ncbi:MAG: tetratricopeptide repeat protein, partial [Acidimicrobiia bacterium]|nr:tetratricopeptide repeat protein [Acidimicrobiia bacterium]